MKGLTWAVDGYGRCFVVALDDIRTVIYCAFSPAAALEFIITYE